MMYLVFNSGFYALVMINRYRIILSNDDRIKLETTPRRGATGVSRFVHARILLLCDCGKNGPAWTSVQIATALGVTTRTVEHTKRRMLAHGMDAALDRKRQNKPAREPIFNKEKEADLIALVCSPPPRGRKRWTVRLLTRYLVAHRVFQRISKSSVQNALKRTELNLAMHSSKPTSGSLLDRTAP